MGHVLPAYMNIFIIISSKNIYKVWVTISDFYILGSKDTPRASPLTEELHAFDTLRPKHLGTALFFPMLLFLSGILCFVKLTPSLIRCHLKTTNKIETFETLKHFCLLFHTGMWKDFHQNAQDWKSQERKIYCLQARPCVFQSGNFTGWAVKGLNTLSQPLHLKPHGGLTV